MSPNYIFAGRFFIGLSVGMRRSIILAAFTFNFPTGMMSTAVPMFLGEVVNSGIEITKPWLY